LSELKITHALGSHVDVAWGDVTLFRYVHHPDVPQLESPKPYLHPVRTLAGDLVTAYRPHDHLWHKGIQLALPHVGQENFWGGVTWIRGKGYEQIDNNGSMDHAGFEALEADGDCALIDERLQWHTQAGEHWIDERRTLGARVLDDSTWVLSWASELDNRSGQDLVLGSPTTNGRPNAGYGGLLWRGPRCFTGGELLTSEGVRDEDAAMGTSGPWAAFLGTQDETMRRQTLAFFSDAEPPWFVRSTPFAVVGPAPWFHEEETLADGDTLELRCEIAIADGAWTAQDVEAFRAGATA
jgi:hypothetical protein